MDKVAMVKREVQLAEWAAQVQECRNSGLSVTQWCANHGMKTKTYYYRLKRLRENVCEQIAFPVGRIETPVSSGMVTVRVRDITVEITDGTSEATIAAVIRALAC